MAEGEGRVLHTTGDTALLLADGELCLRDGADLYQISSHPYEPCTYLLRNGNIDAVIHNAFDESSIRRAAETKGAIRAITGAEYDADRLCRFLAFAAKHCPNHDISYVEGKMAIEKLKKLGATSPKTAVNMSELGVRTISDAFSHSKKMTERVRQIPSGKVYVRINK